jgi:hypothetical protein
MKAIQPVQIWEAGSVKTGNFINAYITLDNLKDTAKFYWAIFDTEIQGTQLTQGDLIMTEPDYSIWDSTADINEAAYAWICDQLSLTLIP